jgi:hypothetical protein
MGELEVAEPDHFLGLDAACHQHGGDGDCLADRFACHACLLKFRVIDELLIQIISSVASSRQKF